MVKAIEIFEKVNLVKEMEQRRFFNALNDTLDELRSMYADILITVNGAADPGEAWNLQDEIEGIDLYLGAIVDNINFINTGNETLKGEFIRKADNAHITDWKNRLKGVFIKRLRW